MAASFKDYWKQYAPESVKDIFEEPPKSEQQKAAETDIRNKNLDTWRKFAPSAVSDIFDTDENTRGRFSPNPYYNPHSSELRKAYLKNAQSLASSRSYDKFLEDWEESMEYGGNPSIPLNNANAQNTAQRSKETAGSLADGYKAVADAMSGSIDMGFGKMVKDSSGKTSYQPNKGGAQDLASVGFQADPKRSYSTEKDAAGNVISISPLAKAGEDPLVTAQAKGWKAPGSEGGAGNPFTPNLNKFIASQNPDVMAKTMQGQNPSDVAQMRQAVSNAAYDSSNVRSQRAESLAKSGMKQNVDGSIESIKGMRPSDKAVITNNILDTTREANQALQAGRDDSNKKFDKATALANKSTAQSQSATQMAMQGMNQQYREGQKEGEYKKPDALAQGFYDASKEMQLQANKTGLQSRNLTNQGSKSLEEGAKQYSELKAIPRTEYTQISSQYGNAYAGNGAKSIGESAAKKIKNKNPNQPNS